MTDDLYGKMTVAERDDDAFEAIEEQKEYEEIDGINCNNGLIGRDEFTTACAIIRNGYAVANVNGVASAKVSDTDDKVKMDNEGGWVDFDGDGRCVLDPEYNTIKCDTDSD